jgi:hypothetical protein
MPHTAFPHLVVATITEDIGPIDRGRKYEDPIDAALKAAGLGEVTGGGSQLDASRRIAFVDIDVALADTEGALDLVRLTLKQLGAPAGSVLSFTRDDERHVVAIDSGAPAAAPSAVTVPQYDDDFVRKTAEKLLASYRTLFAESYALGPIDRDAYDRDVFAWYDEMTLIFASLGFTALGDLKIVKDAAKPEPGAQPFARRFVAAGAGHRADVFQVKSPKDGTWTRVLNLVTETSDGFFLWTSTSVPRWNTSDHVLLDSHAPGTPLAAVFNAHATRVAAYLSWHDGVFAVPLASLTDVLASEDRCQARTGAFRRQQAMPSVEELLRLDSEPTLARLAHAAMRSIVFGESTGGEWQVSTIDLATPRREPMTLRALIDFALDQGIAQVEKVGSPLNPFLITETGRAYFFVCTKGDADPMAIALQTLRTEAASASACALVIDSRIAVGGSAKVDAVLVMASQRDGAEGETWAQGYRPKGLFRAFKQLPLRERVAASKNLFAEATAHI